MEFDAAALERTTQAFRAGMWGTAIAEAIEDFGIEEERFGPVQAIMAGPLGPDFFNLILGAAEPGAVDGGHLAAAVDWADEREAGYRVLVAYGRPGAGAAEDWLNHDGFERGSRRVKLARSASKPVPPEQPGVLVYELGAEEGEGEGLSVIAEEAFHLPGGAGAFLFCLPMHRSWRCYTAALDERVGIVACGSMLIQGDVAQLGIDATLRPARARGCHQALLRRRLLDAAAGGCRTVFAELGECELETTSIASRNLARAGFGEAYCSQEWRRPQAAIGLPDWASLLP
jgi:hypothetical protein